MKGIKSSTFDRNIKLITTFELLICIILLINITYKYNDNSKFPVIELVQSLPDTEYNNNNYSTAGLYVKVYNKIYIPLDAINKQESLSHEYSHYLYEKRMSKYEVNFWNDNLCNGEYLEELYDNKKDLCSEDWSYVFAEYLEFKDYFDGVSLNIQKENQFIFIREMINKYIK